MNRLPKVLGGYCKVIDKGIFSYLYFCDDGSILCSADIWPLIKDTDDVAQIIKLSGVTDNDYISCDFESNPQNVSFNP